MDAPTADERLRIEARVSSLLDGILGKPVRAPDGMSPRELVLIVGILDARAEPRSDIARLTPHLAAVLADVARNPLDDGTRYPALVFVGEWIKLAWVEGLALQGPDVARLVPGGDC